MNAILVIDRLHKLFSNVHAVNDLHLRVPAGCIYGFLGPNGAGKTTTIRMVMDIFKPDRGTIRVLGGEPGKVKDRLGYLPEEKGLYQKMKVVDLATYFGRLKGLNGAVARDRASERLRRYGLGDWLNQRCESLSKGMGQKVQIIATLLHDPELVILDEPFSGLDPVNMELVRDIILDMRREGRTVIFSTHVMAQAEQMCDFVMLINKGQKVFDGTLAQVKAGHGRAIAIDYDGDGSHFQNLPGVLHYRDVGKQVELQLGDDADPQAILAALVGKIAIRRFDTREPSLHEIFIRAIGGQAHD